MPETLLKNNRRAVLGSLALVALVPILGGGLWYAGRWFEWPIIAWTGLAAISLGAVACLRIFLWGRLPRLALSGETLAVHVRGFRIEQVPLDAVECFFIGQAVGEHVRQTPDGSRVENVTIVVRLAQRAQEWHERQMDAGLGRWTDGYITVSGLWCEPINGDFVTEMNHRLAAVKRSRRDAAQK